MVKIKLLWLFFALFVILASCSLPGAPAGSMYSFGEIPGEDDGNRPPTVVQQLALLQQTAQSGSSHVVYARNNEIIQTTQIIYYTGLQDITITIQSYGNNRHMLSLAGNRAMFQVQGHNVTLVLQNIILQGHHENNYSLVIINHGGMLKMNNGSVIRGNYGRGVSVIGGSLSMTGNASVSANLNEGVQVNMGSVSMHNTAQIYGNSGGGVLLTYSILTMRDSSAINNNQRVGGVTMTGGASRLFMHGNAAIHNNNSFGRNMGGGGVTAQQGSRIYMYENATIRHNRNDNGTGGGGIFLLLSHLNMHGDGIQVRNNQSLSRYSGGGVWMSGAGSSLNISGGLISGMGCPNTNFAHGTHQAMYISKEWGNSSVARSGSYTPSGGSTPGVFTPGPARASSDFIIQVSGNGSSGTWGGVPW